MTISEYQRLIRKARENHYEVSKESIAKLEEALQRAYNQIEQMIRGIDGDSLKTAQRKFLKLRKTNLKVVIDGLRNGYAEELRNGMTLTALHAKSISETADSMLLGDKGLVPIAATYAQIPTAAVDMAWRRIGSDGLTLSKRIWNLGKHVQRRTEAIVLSGISRGQSAVSMAKELQYDILGIGSTEDIPESLRWTTGIARSVSGRGTIHYNALRLARTEIGNAYHEADVMSATASTIVAGLKWNLSPAHGQYDICDQLADQDAYGLGDGVYPPEAVPLYPHPNDLCFITRELRSPDEWGTPRPELEPRKKFYYDHPKETTYLNATRKQELTQKVTDAYAKRVESQFEAMVENTVGSARFRGE